MIGKLRRKFVLFAVLSITIVTVFIFGLIATDMKLRSNAELDSILEYIAQNEGEMPEYSSSTSGKFEGFITPESRYSTRYFTVILDEEDNIETTNIDHISSVDEEKAITMAKEVDESNKTRGFYDQFRYLVVQIDTQKMIIFIDAYGQLRNYSDFINKSMIIIFLGIIITAVVAFLLSKKAAGPIVESIEKQKQFITNAGHDLKTPVAIIMANSEVLELKLGEDDEWVQSIKNQTQRLDMLIKNLLNLARVEENNKKKPEFVEFAIDELIEEEVEGIKILAKNKNIQYVKPADIMLITKDKTAISQLISILLDNAIKYAPEESCIKVEVKKHGKNNIRIEISNKYTGNSRISPEKLFDRFYRGDKSRKTNGYGIGLSMAKSIVEANKGKIYCDIDENNMIHFIVIL